MRSEPLPLICDGCSAEESYLKAKSCHWKRGAKSSEAQVAWRKGDLAMCPCIGSHSQVRPSEYSRLSSESVASAPYNGQKPGQHIVYSSLKFRPPCLLEDEISYNVAESVKAAGEEEDLRPYFTPHVLPYPSDCESRPSTDLSTTLCVEGYSPHFSSGLMPEAQKDARGAGSRLTLPTRVVYWFKRVLRRL